MLAMVACIVLASCTDTIGTADNPVAPVQPGAADELASEKFIHEEWMDRSVKPGDSFWQFAQGTWLKNHDAMDQGLSSNEGTKQSKELVDDIESYQGANHTLQLIKGLKPSQEEQMEVIKGVLARLKDGDDISKADVIRNIGKLADLGICPLMGHNLAGIDGILRYYVMPGLVSNPFFEAIPSVEVALPVVKEMFKNDLGVDIDNEETSKIISKVVEIDLWIKDFKKEWIRTVPVPAFYEHEQGRGMLASTLIPANKALTRRSATRMYQGDDDMVTAFREAFHIDENTYYVPEVDKIFELIERTDVAALQFYLKYYAMMKFNSAVINESMDSRQIYKSITWLSNSIFLDYQKDMLVKEEACQDALQTLEELRGVFAERIQNADWLSSDTKAKALEKLKAMKFNIGGPEKLFNADFKLTGKTPVEDVVQYLEQTDNYLRNVVNGKPCRDYPWEFLFLSPMGVGIDSPNAAYDGTTNQLFILPFFLRSSMFPSDKNDARRYATLVVFGHEMTHGFDNNGATFDGIGNKKDWWTAEDKSKFEQRMRMMVDRYNELEQVPGVPANGEMTKAENIADLGGFTLAWEMWNRHLKAEGLSGEAMRHQQRQFFLSVADLWQSDNSDAQLMISLNTDTHSANHNRVNGIFRLMDEWYDLFGVQPDDKLYVKPEDRVKIW